MTSLSRTLGQLAPKLTLADVAARLFFALFAAIAISPLAKWISNVQMRYPHGRKMTWLLLAPFVVWAVFLLERLPFLAIAILGVAITLTMAFLMMGMHIPRWNARVIAYSSYKTAEFHLLRVAGFGEKRHLRSDLVALVEKTVLAGASCLKFSSPLLSKERESEHVSEIVASAVAEHGGMARWKLTVSEPFWMGVFASENFKRCYGDTMTNEQLENTRRYRMFGVLPTPFIQVQARTVEFVANG